jgi:hypothetical protein
MKKLTCREHCWKYKLCEVGQDKNTLCRFFEPKSNFLGEKDKLNRIRAENPF